jgi:UV DNA damage endonuclease
MEQTLNFPARPLRLGFAVKVLGQAGLKSNDTRRWQSEPHLRVSLEYLHHIVDYLVKNKITMYRMSSDLAPYATHPDMPQFHNQIDECSLELRQFGDLVRQHNLRMSFHPSQFIVLNSPDPVLVEKSIRDLQSQAHMLDCMGVGPEAVLIIHVGGTYGDRNSGCERWIETYHRLPENVRNRLVLENDDIRYSAADVLRIHEHTGVPLVFDVQHYWCNNAEGLDLLDTLRRFVRSWPTGVRPKIHYSTPNTNFREVQQRDRKTNKLKKAQVPPIWTGHADYINPFEFITFMRMAKDLEFDIMLESKAKDLALLRLERDLPRYAPDVAVRFGLEPTAPVDPVVAAADDVDAAEADVEAESAAAVGVDD